MKLKIISNPHTHIGGGAAFLAVSIVNYWMRNYVDPVQMLIAGIVTSIIVLVVGIYLFMNKYDKE